MASSISQDDLADKVGSAGAHQVSRWENGKTLPSTDTIVKLAECFEVSIDYLLIDDAPRRPLRSEGDGFVGRPGDVGQLTDDEQASVLTFVDALLAKKRLKSLAADLG
jgi:transcriptional regulator with XRE-family HTH domain